LDIVDWTSLREDLDDRGFLGRPGLVVAATRWTDAGKIDYALGGRAPVICLGPDARQYGLSAKRHDYARPDVLIAPPRASRVSVIGLFGFLFEWIDPVPPAEVQHAGHAAMVVPLFIGHRLHAASAMSTDREGSP